MIEPIPGLAGKLLDFIQMIEAPRGYDTIYANKPTTKQLTQMTVMEVLMAQPTWSRQNGSSAAGGFQFMRKTLAGLVTELGLPPEAVFTRELQRRLGWHLLKRRGYAQFMQGQLTVPQFGLRLAQEWASFPVLTDTKGAHRNVKRGETYYAGDGVNKALVKPERMEAILNALIQKPGAVPIPTPKPGMSTTTKVVAGAGCVAGTGAAIVAGTQEAQTTLEQVEPITNTLFYLGRYGALVAGVVVGSIVLFAVGVALYKWAKE